MKDLRSQIYVSLVLTFVVTGMAGCGNDESSANSGETWFDADPVKQMYVGKIRLEAIEAGKTEADRSCEAVLPLARKSLNDSGNGTVVQIMYKLCDNAGLKFQSKIRCESDRLQVLCR